MHGVPCMKFQNVDHVFNKEKLDLNKINNINGPYIRYCPNDKASKKHKCNSDLDGINALCMYLFTELFKRSKGIQKRENNDYQYVECNMM
ncbi:Plasmodium variant antigen protein Cir/Yir/Bir, putative [Plasmodium chabaudi chabaudi]|uniref:Plasmodium variant antigen protein Cir/Yir/Bir, putative n=1 Tax=Plasmodium chabaudi chabaudi TaxID=31271 RepID=A0A1C6YEB6_PLACU|nr:Plasmodium variant antigen protein Cir/Yir/Bir, putative [Plasmodium chabaudi chabaudi]